MKEVSVISRTTPARPRSKNYVQGTAIYGGGGSKDILIPTNYIRDDQDDGTNYLLYVGTFLDSIKEGTGIGLFPEGRAQADKFEARKQIQIGEAMLFWDDANKAIGIKRVAVQASEDGTGEIKESEIGVYSQGWMSAKGIDQGEEEGTGGATTIGQLVNVGEWADQTAPYDRILVQISGSNMWTEKKLSEIGGGIDEGQLESYLTRNNYAKKTDIPSLEGYATETWVTDKGYITSAALTGYATQSWVLGKSYATTSDLDARIDALVNGAPAAYDTLKEIADVLQGNVDSIGDIITTLGTKADKTITITAGTGLTGGGNLSANRTISLETVGKAGTYTKVVVDAYGRVTSHSSLSASDIPTLSISKISGLQEELDSKLDADVLNDLFEKVEIRSGVYAIRAKYGLYSNEFISAKGMDEGEEGGSGSSYLSDLLDVSLTSLAENDLLKWNGTKWVNVPMSSIAGASSWDEITGKPSTFPPSAHVHNQYYDSENSRTANTVLAAPNGENGKATFRKLVSADLPIHSHDWGNITGTPTSVSGYGIVDAYSIKSGSPDNEKGMIAGYYANVGSYASFVQRNYGGQFSLGAGGVLRYRGVNANFAGSWKQVAFITDTVAAADKLTTNAGSNINPIYFTGGVPKASSYSFGNSSGNIPISNGTLCTNLNADKLDGLNVIGNSSETGIKKLYVFGLAAGSKTYIKLGTLPTPLQTGTNSSKVKLRIYGGIDLGGREEATWEVIASTRNAIYVNSTLVNGAKQLKIGYISTSSGVEIWAAFDGNYITKTAIEIEVSERFTVAMTRQSTKPSGFTEGSYRLLLATGTDGILSVNGIKDVERITFAEGDSGRKTVITNGGSFMLYAATSGWAGGVSYYSNDGSTSLGTAAGGYGSGNVLNYYFYGGTYNSPKMVILSSGNVGIGTTAPNQKLHVAGNLLADGAITCKAVSDIRLKTVIQEEVDYRKKLLELGSVVDFRYNDKAIQRNTGAVDKEKHTGLIYQSAKELGLPNFCHTDDDGYGSINYLCTDYINLIAGALQQTIVAQETIEQRVERLERENEELRRKLNNLTAA